MTADRNTPFSAKHRRYWFPVTGGMILIGAINVGLGVCSYDPPTHPERIDLGVTQDAPLPDAANTIARSQIPAEVMRAFVAKFPRTVPQGASRVNAEYVIAFSIDGSPHQATFLADGTFVKDE